MYIKIKYKKCSVFLTAIYFSIFYHSYFFHNYKNKTTFILLQTLITQDAQTITGSTSLGSRFGTAISVVGDLNKDTYNGKSLAAISSFIYLWTGQRAIASLWFPDTWTMTRREAEGHTL